MLLFVTITLSSSSSCCNSSVSNSRGGGDAIITTIVIITMNISVISLPSLSYHIHHYITLKAASIYYHCQ